MKNYFIATDKFTEEQQNELKTTEDYESEAYLNNEPYQIITVREAKNLYNFPELQDEEATEDYCVLLEMTYAKRTLVTNEQEIDRLLEVNEMTEEKYLEAYSEDDEYCETVMSAYHRAIFGYGI